MRDETQEFSGCSVIEEEISEQCAGAIEFRVSFEQIPNEFCILLP